MIIPAGGLSRLIQNWITRPELIGRSVGPRSEDFVDGAHIHPEAACEGADGLPGETRGPDLTVPDHTVPDHTVPDLTVPDHTRLCIESVLLNT
jgi:hypothetical protein